MQPKASLNADTPNYCVVFLHSPHFSQGPLGLRMILYNSLFCCRVDTVFLMLSRTLSFFAFFGAYVVEVKVGVSDFFTSSSCAAPPISTSLP